MRRFAIAALSITLGAAFVWHFWSPAHTESAQDATKNVAIAGASAPAPSPFEAFWSSVRGQGNPLSPLTPEAQRSREQRLQALRERYERAEQTYNTYRDATRYPHDSRPMADHADQTRPFDPVSEEKTMRNERGEPVKAVKIRSAQSHVFLSGTDVAKFSIQAVDDKGSVLPLSITRAAAQNLPDSKQLVPIRSVSLDFSDNGPQASNGADDVAGDGQFSARLSPSEQGFSGNVGTIRVLVFYRANGNEGVAHFDVVYTESVPASWVDGGVREVAENGSLSFYVKAQIRVAGRYVVSTRVDDANGNPFAYLSFNEELASGAREIKLTLFGALIRDKRPVFPLQLRDMDGFLLIPDQFPDRQMMPRRLGVIFKGGSHRWESFSDAEWRSEERDRHLTEYAKDLDEAKKALSDSGESR